jgi:hypothetical protein
VGGTVLLLVVAFFVFGAHIGVIELLVAGVLLVVVTVVAIVVTKPKNIGPPPGYPAQQWQQGPPGYAPQQPPPGYGPPQQPPAGYGPPPGWQGGPPQR